MIYSGRCKLEEEWELCQMKYLKMLIRILVCVRQNDRLMIIKMNAKPFNILIMQVYAPTTDCEESELEKFYDEMDKATKQCKSDELLIVMGDLNAKVGDERIDDVVGPHGLGKQNERGERWIEWCCAHELITANTWFQQPARRIYTRKSPGDRARNQIDYIAIKKRYRNAVKQAKTHPGADINRDHVSVRSTIKMQLKNVIRQKQHKSLDYAAPTSDKEIKLTYAVKVSNRFEILEEENDKSSWEIFKEAIVETAK